MKDSVNNNQIADKTYTHYSPAYKSCSYACINLIRQLELREPRVLTASRVIEMGQIEIEETNVYQHMVTNVY